jgi:hypothetical protein
MRFTIRELVLVTVIVAMGVCLWQERKRSAELEKSKAALGRLKALHERVAREAVELDRQVFEGKMENRDLKRRLEARNRWPQNGSQRSGVGPDVEPDDSRPPPPGLRERDERRLRKEQLIDALDIG